MDQLSKCGDMQVSYKESDEDTFASVRPSVQSIIATDAEQQVPEADVK